MKFVMANILMILAMVKAAEGRQPVFMASAIPDFSGFFGQTDNGERIFYKIFSNQPFFITRDSWRPFGRPP